MSYHNGETWREFTEIRDKCLELEQENAALRASNKRLWNWLNNILTGMKEQSGDPYDECPYCMSELFCYDEQLEIQAKIEELEQDD